MEYSITANQIFSYMRGKGYHLVTSKTFSWWSKVIAYHELKVIIQIFRWEDGLAPEAFTDPVQVSVVGMDGEECMMGMEFDTLKDFFGINMLEKVQRELDAIFEGI